MGLAREGKAAQAASNMQSEFSSPGPSCLPGTQHPGLPKIQTEEERPGGWGWQVQVADLETL